MYVGILSIFVAFKVLMIESEFVSTDEIVYEGKSMMEPVSVGRRAGSYNMSSHSTRD